MTKPKGARRRRNEPWHAFRYVSEFDATWASECNEFIAEEDRMRMLMIAVALFSNVALAGGHSYGGHRSSFEFEFSFRYSSVRQYGCHSGYHYPKCGHGGNYHGGYYSHGRWGRPWFGGGRMAHRRAHRLFNRGAYVRGHWAMNRANRRAARWM